MNQEQQIIESGCFIVEKYLKFKKNKFWQFQDFCFILSFTLSICKNTCMHLPECHVARKTAL